MLTTRAEVISPQSREKERAVVGSRGESTRYADSDLAHSPFQCPEVEGEEGEEDNEDKEKKD